MKTHLICIILILFKIVGENLIHAVQGLMDYSLDDGVLKPTDTLVHDGIYFLGNESSQKIRPKVISRSVYLRKNEIYSRKNHNITLNRLMTMGNFKFVRMNFISWLYYFCFHTSIF